MFDLLNTPSYESYTCMLNSIRNEREISQYRKFDKNNFYKLLH